MKYLVVLIVLISCVDQDKPYRDYWQCIEDNKEDIIFEIQQCVESSSGRQVTNDPGDEVDACEEAVRDVYCRYNLYN